ncbi:anaerobic ribonucleoside-triphosphate reductase [Candidatus Dependentiae bacterium]|nr:anaerobic ribonucleoside-triphosphate reductase [Candidatus Dependentiae bacterium]
MATSYLNGYPKDFQELYNKANSEILNLEGIAPEKLTIKSMAEQYFHEHPADMSIDGNANVNEGKSYGNYISEITKGWLKLQGYYNLYEILKETFGVNQAGEIIHSIWNGDLYMHDSTAIQIPYCWAYSTHFLIEKGNYWGQLQSLPPHRRRSFIDQVKEVTIEIAQEIAGAVAIGDLFVNYAYFVKKENIDIANPYHRKDIENDFQSLVHTLNKKLRPSHQSPFTNLSIFDRPNLEYLFGDLHYPDGSKPDFDIVEQVQKIFCDWFSKGDPISGLPYRFPVVTLNLRTDKNQNILDKNALEYFSKINLENGCFNIYISSGNKIASCCRLVNDLELGGCDSFGNGGISLGSHRVVTINLARLGRLAGSPENVISLLDKQLEASKNILVAHRKLLQRRIDQGFLKFFRYDIMHIKRLFSTFGINGIYECLEELNIPITTPEGKALAHKLLNRIKNYAHECAKTTGNSFNVEQVPAESLAVKFAAKDALLYGMNYSLYANQFIPLWVDQDITDKIKLDGEFSKTLTGGGISHLNLGEKLTSSNQMKKIIEYSVKSGCEHFAINYNFCKCTNEHITVAGPSKVCSICGNDIIENFTRVIGYFTPVSAWNKGRRKEHGKRIFKKQDDITSEIVINKMNKLPQKTTE